MAKRPSTATTSARASAGKATVTRAAPMSADAMRAALTAAAKRLLGGKPIRTDGALGPTTLCREAGVVRGSAYRVCRDVFEDFEQKVEALAANKVSNHPLIRLERRADEAEKLAAALAEELETANARIATLANQLNMAMRRVVKAEELRESDRESIEAERVRTSKEIAKLQEALGTHGRSATKTGAVLALHRSEDK